MDEFYTNHRNWIDGKSRSQLRKDKEYTVDDLEKQCEFVYKNEQLRTGTTLVDGTVIDDTNKGNPAVPCGLIGKYIFNDAFGFNGFSYKTDKDI